MGTETGVTDPENGSTSYVYDTLNRLQTLTPPSAFSGIGNFGFSYDALSRRTQMTRPNGLKSVYAYDNLSRLLSVLHQSGSTTLDGATYAVDNAGNRTSRTPQPSGTASNFSYDNIYELTQVTQGASTTESYTYDPVGNRLSSLGLSPYNVNTSNELTSTPSTTYTYDYNGNTLTSTTGANTTSYAWDFENRMSSVTLPGSGGTVTFAYDPFGRRIKKVTSTATSIFAYDGDNLIEETNSSGAAVARYEPTQNIDEPLAMLRSGATSYFHADGLGSVTSLSNAAGSIANTYTYDSFGKLTASTGSLVNPFQYTARESDSETGLYYYRARYYGPDVGRFISEDPVRFHSDGTNLYPYVGNNPVREIDPSGLSHRCWGLCGGKCCNFSSNDEWWLDDGVWKRLPPGKCTNILADCDGMTCGGGFYYLKDVIDFPGGACKTPGKDSCKFAPRRWTPNRQGPNAQPPGPPYPGYSGPNRGGPVGNPPPPGYTWGNQ